MGTENEVSTTHERLLTVASTLFAERGYLGASMSDIAREVGVRKPSLYNYVRSKDELFLALLDKSLEGWQDASRPALEEQGPLEACLRAHLHQAVDFAATHPEAVAICRLAVTQLTGPIASRVETRLQAQRTSYQAVLDARFADAVATGELRQGEVEPMALAWIAFLDGVLFNQSFPLGYGPAMRDHLDGLWDVLWRGLAARS